MMLQCLYCTNAQFELGKGSEEHVILSSLGGKKSSRNICCEACNNKYGGEIDVVLSKEFHFFCTMIGIRTGRGKDAPTQLKILTTENEKYDLLPGGKNRLSDNTVEFTDGENSSTVSITARDEETALKLLNVALRKYGKDLKDLSSVSGINITGYPDPMTGRISIGQEFYRSIAKMALTYVATLISPKRLRGEEFLKITSFIKGEHTSNDYVRIESANVFPSAPGIDELNHRIFFLATAEKKRAIVLLELFGSFRFSVLLSDVWSGESSAKVHVINPITHKRSDQDLPPTDTIYDEIQKQTDAQQIEAVKTAITTAGAVINRRQRKTMVSQIVGEAFNDQESGPDRVVSEAELTIALEKISAEVARFITRSPLKENIDLTAFIHNSKKNDI